MYVTERAEENPLVTKICYQARKEKANFLELQDVNRHKNDVAIRFWNRLGPRSRKKTGMYVQYKYVRVRVKLIFFCKFIFSE